MLEDTKEQVSSIIQTAMAKSQEMLSMAEKALATATEQKSAKAAKAQKMDAAKQTAKSLLRVQADGDRAGSTERIVRCVR